VSEGSVAAFFGACGPALRKDLAQQRCGDAVKQGVVQHCVNKGESRATTEIAAILEEVNNASFAPS
ncbi:MAG: hypothetical protein AAFQ28_11445, partial [Pseudomonadota bacterium]